MRGVVDFPALGEQSEMVVKQENFNVRLFGGVSVFSFELVLIKVAVKVSQSISVWEMIQSNPYLASICRSHRIFSLLSNWPTDLSVQLIGCLLPVCGKHRCASLRVQLGGSQGRMKGF